MTLEQMIGFMTDLEKEDSYMVVTGDWWRLDPDIKLKLLAGWIESLEEEIVRTKGVIQ